jgi:hypothetical protein
MDTRDIERPRHSALAEYAPLSGILILAALMCLCVFLLANEVKRSGAVLVQSAQPETIGEARALSSPLGLPIAPALASSQSSSEASVMLDQGDGERNAALADRKRIKSVGERSEAVRKGARFAEVHSKSVQDIRLASDGDI